jgi:hypothetical protein
VSELSDWTTTCGVCVYFRTFTLRSCSFYHIYFLFASSVMFYIYILDIHILCNTGEYPNDNPLPLHGANNSDRPLPDQSNDNKSFVDLLLLDSGNARELIRGHIYLAHVQDKDWQVEHTVKKGKWQAAMQD